MPVEIQTRAGADEFTGTAGEGLFTWEDLDKLPRTARVVLETVDLRIVAGGNAPVDEARIFLRPRGATDTDPSVSLAFTGDDDGNDGSTTNPDGSLDLHGLAATQFNGSGLVAGGPPRLLPRTDGVEHWELAFVTDGKARKGFAIVDWRIQTFPESAS